jgi:uncharacterized protein (TIGR02270 family)
MIRRHGETKRKRNPAIMIVPAVVQQHADDAAVLSNIRMALVTAPYPTLDRIGRFDRRLAAHLDGLRLAGEEGWSFCEAALETPSAGAMFAVAVRALDSRDDNRLQRLFALAEALPEASRGLLAAFEWTERTRLQGTVANLLREPNGYKRMFGIAACSMHRVDPGLGLGQQLQKADLSVRACGFRAAGELALVEMLSACVEATRSDDDGNVRFWAGWSAVLLGDRHAALDRLTTRGLKAGPHRGRAFRLALQVMSATAAHALLQDLPRDRQGTRWLIQGSGIAGDPAYLPWLLKRMAEQDTARLAGEAFSTIVGVNLGQAALDRPAPENVESGPNDDPDDPDVEMDPDDGLSWPDVERIEKWWSANVGRFQSGQRYFMGAPVTREHCIDVLKNGYQRQRILAAHYLCLLEPGTPLFNTSAPAWRQQRLLAKMG